MPELDLSPVVPASATWVKIHYEMTAAKPDAELIARFWSGSMDDAVIVKGAEGDAFIKLNIPQKLFYQRPVTVELKMKVVAYKAAEE